MFGLPRGDAEHIGLPRTSTCCDPECPVLYVKTFLLVSFLFLNRKQPLPCCLRCFPVKGIYILGPGFAEQQQRIIRS
jgi:hypothetical protein